MLDEEDIEKIIEKDKTSNTRTKITPQVTKGNRQFEQTPHN